jgi:hypothetical protein
VVTCPPLNGTEITLWARGQALLEVLEGFDDEFIALLEQGRAEDRTANTRPHVFGG